MPPVSRRSFTRSLAASSLALPGSLRATTPAAPPNDEVWFFVTADPQIHLDKWGTAGTEATIHTINQLPGQPFPPGGTIGTPRAVLVLGDLVDVTNDPRHWHAYTRLFDPNGKALLRFPAFEGIGNHDLSPESADGFSNVQSAFIQRSRSRTGPESFRYCSSHYHYSWDWNDLHLVQLNLFPGNSHRPVYDRPAPWNNPRQSLDFLRSDLKATVGSSQRPVILLWHYGLRGWGLEKWWTPADLAALRETIAPYNIAAILHGHEHSFAQYTWEGFPVFMCPSPQKDRDPKSPDSPSTPKGFLALRYAHGQLDLAHHTDKGWAETWSRKVFPVSTK
jgi:hypothetical protein